MLPEERPRLDQLGPVGGALQRVDGLLADVDRNAGHASELGDELGRGREVMGDLIDLRLAVIFEDRRDPCVAPGAFGLGERAVRDLVDQVRLEVEVVVVVELDQVAPGEPVEHLLRVGAIGESEHGRDRPARADDRASPRAMNARPGRARRGAAGEEAVQRGRHLADPRCVARLQHERDELLDEEGIAAAALEQKRDRLGIGVAVEERAHELAGRVFVERIELQRDPVVLAGLGCPPRLDVGPGGRDEHEGAVAQAGEQSLAQLEGVVGRPVQIRQHEHERLLQRECFEHRQCGSQCFVSARLGSTPGRGDPFEQVHQPFDDPIELHGVGLGSEHVRGLRRDAGACLGGLAVCRRPDACRSASAIGPNALGSP